MLRCWLHHFWSLDTTGSSLRGTTAKQRSHKVHVFSLHKQSNRQQNSERGGGALRDVKGDQAHFSRGCPWRKTKRLTLWPKDKLFLTPGSARFYYKDTRTFVFGELTDRIHASIISLRGDPQSPSWQLPPHPKFLHALRVSENETASKVLRRAETAPWPKLKTKSNQEGKVYHFCHLWGGASTPTGIFKNNHENTTKSKSDFPPPLLGGVHWTLPNPGKVSLK